MEYQNENKTCQNCKNDFLIEANDFSFYEKIKVPAPTWCPPCRMIRRLSFGNAWGVHFRNCEKCGVKTLTMYRPENSIKVYCDPCWWADNWDGTEYGIDYDNTRPFLEQWLELRNKTPHFAKDALYLTLKNCDYTNAIAFSKNCYMSFWADYCENVYYSSLLNEAKDSIDLFRIYKTELSYDSVGLGMSSKVFYSLECDSCVDVWFSRNCYGCINCIGCVNQRGKSYMIFNEQYSREEYFEKLKEFKLNTRSGIKALLEKSESFWKSLPYREYQGNPKNLNVKGDYIFESKNAKDCYMCIGVEDSKYTQFVSVPKATNCMDYYGWGNGVDLIYECATSGEGLQNMKFSFGCFANGLDSEYCGFVIGSNHNFGCVNLKRKKYCILNKEYSKEEYEKLRLEIIEDMNKNPYIDSKGRVFKYGEFFPPEFSMFPYVDSNANKFFSKTKEEALKEGYNWQDKIINNYTKTIDGFDLPDSSEEFNDEILKEIVSCVGCENCFRFTKGELDLYRKLNLPLPDNCPKCRESRRLSLVNMPISFESKCDNCKKDLTTMHNPKNQKIIYCEKCYQQVF